jgi:cell division septal protein FtsQ
VRINAKRVLIFISFGLVIILTIYLPRIVKINSVTCESQFGPCSPNLSEKLALLRGTPVGETRKRVSEILASDILVKKFSIQFKLPNNFEVNILERKPKFALNNSGRSTVTLVDEEGYIVAIEVSTNLPRVIIHDFPGNVGEKVSKENLFALQVVGDLFTFYQIKKGEVDKDNLRVELKNGVKVIFPLEGDRSVLISSLELVLKRYGADSDLPDEIDLRYKNPVIRE